MALNKSCRGWPLREARDARDGKFRRNRGAISTLKEHGRKIHRLAVRREVKDALAEEFSVQPKPKPPPPKMFFGPLAEDLEDAEVFEDWDLMDELQQYHELADDLYSEEVSEEFRQQEVWPLFI
jgi:hypothetical protein